MKIVTKHYKVYEFKELSNEAKDKVIDDWYEAETYPLLEEDILNEMNWIDEYKIFEDAKLCYSLSYSQGDGLSFESTINLQNFLNNIYSKKLTQYKKNAMCEYIYSVGSNQNTGHYCYAHKNDIDFEGNCENYNKNMPHIERLWHDVVEEITEYYLDMCKKLETCGYSIIDYRMDNKEFIEFCESNEYNFDENGVMVNL